MTPSEKYWNRRAFAETKAALGCEDARIAALHVDMATRCVRQVLAERERREAAETLEMPPPTVG